MLRIVQNTSAAGAKSYYSSADYYSQGQELVGQWRGKGAARLGLSGEIGPADWDALCDNQNPSTGGKLMPRTKAVRRIGYDINFHVPKSVSVLYALTQDEGLLGAFKEAVSATMQEMEAEVQTRVRKEGKDEDRTTGNLVWGEFVHLTARPVGGIPDPHLHAHCFAFNTTYDQEEQRWKAGQFAVLKRDAPYFEAVFHSVLARKVEQLGLPVVRTRAGWEIQGVGPALVSKFSRRTAQIELLAESLGITDPMLKGNLGATTREAKDGKLTMPQLEAQWRGRLSPDEASAIDSLGRRSGSTPIPEDDKAAVEAVKAAISHCFEMTAVLPERTLLAEALKRSIGKASPSTVIDLVQREQLITRDVDGQRMVTSREVLKEEQSMLDYARLGRGTCVPLGPKDHAFKRDHLSEEQKRAVKHVLTSTDRVILIRGAAGTGKTTMMQEAAAGIQAGGREVFAFAPSSAASHGVLRNEAGFEKAETVQQLLVNQKLQEQARGQVLWIDEAGLLGSRVTKQVLDLAAKLDARVVLSGDRRQHGSVERGGTLKLLEEEAGLIPAELREVRRQSGEYMRAVRALSDGRVEEGFSRLSDLGWIKEVPSVDRYQVLAKAYVESARLPGDTLVVCPTHHESAKITSEIRQRLKETGAIRKEEHEFTLLRPVNLTEADRKDRLNYLPGDVIEFHQNAPGHLKGSRMTLGRAGDASPPGEVPSAYADRFTIFRPSTIRLAVGDRIRVTKNRTPNKKSQPGEPRLSNGDVFTVRGFNDQGGISLSNGATLTKEWGHLDYGFVVTSHASQGRSVARVLIGQSSESFRASSREQFYVSVSRGKTQATIFTDDKRALLDAVKQTDPRITATELVTSRDPRRRVSVRTAMERPLTQGPERPLTPAGKRREELIHER